MTAPPLPGVTSAARLEPLAPEQLSPEQRRLAEQIAGPRHGIVGGPFALWLRTPEIADAANRFGNAVRLTGRLDRKLFELIVLVVAQRWQASYEWHTHAKAAASLGLAAQVIEAIRVAGDTTGLLEPAEQLAVEATRELLQTNRWSAPLYDKLSAMFLPEERIELVSTIGFYTTVAFMLNAFEVPVPA